jgi:hypothetical protein
VVKEVGLGGKSGSKFLVFGNPLVDGDSAPLRLIPRLRMAFPELEFKEFDPNENMEGEGRNLNIIDAVEGIDKVTLLTNIDSIKTQRIYSMHDFDLGYNLKLLKKLNMIDGVRIFGVPMKIGDDEAYHQLVDLIRSMLSDSPY